MRTSEHTGDLLAALLRAKANFQPIVKSEDVKVTTKTGRSYTFRYAPLSESKPPRRPPSVRKG